MSESAYDRSTSALWSAFIVIGAACCLLVAIWLQMLPERKADHPVGQGGPHEIQIESRFQETAEANLLTDVQTPEQDEQTFTEFATLHQLMAIVDAQPTSDGMPKLGTIGESIGAEGDGIDGQLHVTPTQPQKRKHEWFFAVDAPKDQSEYASMLSGLGIELAAVFSDGRIVYLDLAEISRGKTSVVRQFDSFEHETRYFTTWNGGDLQVNDRALFEFAGVDVAGAKLIQLIPETLEQQLQEKEAAFAGRSKDQIRRTWFRLAPSANGFVFTVTRQSER